MNINLANVCGGSGTTPWNSSSGRNTCPSCQRGGIRVRKNGRLYKHSKKGPKG